MYYDLLSETPLTLEFAEAVIHCATANNEVSKNVVGGLSLSVTGTGGLIESARLAGIKNFCFLSTAQVYGTELSGCIEAECPKDWSNFYSVNHLLGEDLCRYFSLCFGLNIACVRPSNVFGVPPVKTVRRDTLVPNCFIKEAVATGQITLKSTGLQTRNFISLDCLGECFSELLDGFPRGFSCLNMGSEWTPTILEISEIIGEQYKQIFNDTLKIKTVGTEPERSNIFQYKSAFTSPLCSQESSREEMKKVISSLIEREKW